MRGAIIFTGSGPLVILTSHEGLEDPAFLERLAAKGVTKFVGYPIEPSILRAKYGNHFDVVQERLDETDDLRVLDFDGQRALKLLPFACFGEPVFHESAQETADAE